MKCVCLSIKKCWPAPEPFATHMSKGGRIWQADLQDFKAARFHLYSSMQILSRLLNITQKHSMGLDPSVNIMQHIHSQQDPLNTAPILLLARNFTPCLSFFCTSISGEYRPQCAMAILHAGWHTSSFNSLCLSHSCSYILFPTSVLSRVEMIWSCVSLLSMMLYSSIKHKI